LQHSWTEKRLPEGVLALEIHRLGIDLGEVPGLDLETFEAGSFERLGEETCSGQHQLLKKFA
jgi:hypothetical protein